jgi:hypothetical protein
VHREAEKHFSCGKDSRQTDQDAACRLSDPSRNLQQAQPQRIELSPAQRVGVSHDLMVQGMKETIGGRVQEQTEKVGLEAGTGESIRLQRDPGSCPDSAGSGRSSRCHTCQQVLIQSVAVVGLVPDQPLRRALGKSALKSVFDKSYLAPGSIFDTYGDRKTIAVCDCHDLGPLALLGFSDTEPPFLAGANVPSIKASDRSMSPRASKSSAKARRIFSTVPSFTHCWKLRWQVWYDGYLSGRSFQGAPVRNTQRIPLRTSRVLRHGRPRPSLRRGGWGISGYNNCHCSSVRSMEEMIHLMILLSGTKLRQWATLLTTLFPIYEMVSRDVAAVSADHPLRFMVLSEEIRRVGPEWPTTVEALNGLNPEVVQHDPLTSDLVDRHVERTNATTHGLLERPQGISEIGQCVRLQLETRDSAGYRIHVDANNCRAEATGFDNGRSSAHEGIKDGDRL